MSHCGICNDTGVTIECPYCLGPEADYHTACFEVEMPCWACDRGLALDSRDTVTA